MVSYSFGIVQSCIFIIHGSVRDGVRHEGEQKVFCAKGAVLMKYIQKYTIFHRSLLWLQKTPYQLTPISTMSDVLVRRALVRGKRTLAGMSRS